MILSAEVECYIYHSHSLKEKRAVLQRILTRIRQRFNMAVAEIGYQNHWQRTKIALVTVSSSKVVAEKECTKALAIIDSFPDIERTVTEIHWL